MSIKHRLAGKAFKSTAKHSARGTTSKLKRDPVRSTVLIGVGAALGLLAGWMLGRATGGDPEPAPG